MSRPHAQTWDWVRQLGLEQHPEGGWFRRIHTSAETIAIANGSRPLATSIHYLLDREQPVGRLHSNRSGILHFIQHGGPVEYVVVHADGRLETRVLGFGKGQALSLFVAGGRWKASRLIGDASHALVSEVVTPGFDYADHRFVDCAAVQQQWPQHLAALVPFLRTG